MFPDFQQPCICEVNNKKKIILETSNDYCAYEEYENVELSHADLMLQEKTRNECEEQCNSYEGFNCRGFTVLSENTTNCILHSEDTKLRGPRVLRSHQGALYYEKARCLNSKSINDWLIKH